MPTNPLIKLKKGAYSSLGQVPYIDGTLYFGQNATIEGTAARADQTERNLFILDVDDNGTVNRRKLDAYRACYSDLAGNATTSDYWSSPIAISICSSDGTGVGAGVQLQGTSDVSLVLPTSIKADITGNVTGNASTANALNVANQIGSSSKPVYINASGLPVACGSTLDVSIDGTAQNAQRWATAQSFRIVDTGTGTARHQGASVTVDGTLSQGQTEYVLTLPSVITAVLNGRANSALKLVNESNQNLTTTVPENTQNRYYPVRFVDGVPVAITGTLENNIAGKAAAANEADALSVGQVGSDSTPVYINSNGIPTAIQSIPVSLLSGVIPQANLPKSVQERLFITSRLDNDNAATDLAAIATFIASKANTNDPVEAGDVVELTDPYGGVNNEHKLYYIYENSQGELEAHPFSAGSAANATQAGVADALSHSVQWRISDYDGTNNGSVTPQNTLANDTTITISLPQTIKASLNGNASTASALLMANDSAVGSATRPVYFNASGRPVQCNDSLDSSITGNAATANRLSSFVTINGSAFDGSNDIVTSYWGTARNITIVDTGTGADKHSGTVVSVNGSQAYELPLPSTITADLNGNAATATTASNTVGQLSLFYTSITNLDDPQPLVSFNGSANVQGEINPNLLFPVYTTTVTLSSALSAGTWTPITIPTNMSNGTYIVQIKTNNHTFNNEYFSGIMSFYGGTTAGSDSDEVLLHAAGANLNGKRIYLKVVRTNTSPAEMLIKYCSDVNLNSGDVLTFTFRKML